MVILPYPVIDPDIFRFGPYAIGGWSVGPFAVRWYALAYIAGLIIGWRYCMALAKRPPQVARVQDIDDFLVWATLGVVLGGRTGYVLFYNLEHYLQHPIEIFFLWRGGMSFHGGALGVCIAIALFCRQRKINLLCFADIISCAVPIGLFFGRIANFINDELWGRVTDVPWAMIFPTGAVSPAEVPLSLLKFCQPATLFDGSAGLNCPRHPSQLYEAALEGLVLFSVLWLCQHRGLRQRPGAVSGVFLIGYGLARITVEFFRQPDPQLGFLFGGITMGQLLSVPLLFIGAWLVLRAKPIAART
jgi:phosphatidylglycerol---prolipoprotein diacylglyceryl transferase